MMIVRNICRFCSTRCGVRFHIENGKIVKAEGDPDNPDSKGIICPRGRAIPEIIYAPDRIRYPLKKDGNDWKRISWEEAVSTIGDALLKIRDTYGPESLNIHAGITTLVQDFRPFLYRFADAFGTPNVTSAGSQCSSARLIANTVTFGEAVSPDFKNSRCIVLWGANPTTSHILHASDIAAAMKNGAKLIVVDPEITPLAEKADIHIRVKPGTDGALAMGMINCLVQQDLFDHTFVADWTTGFDDLAAAADGYTLSSVAGITGVPEDDIKSAAFLYGSTKPACIDIGNAMEHHRNGVQAIRAIALLQALTGNIDIPGGSVMRRSLAFARLRMKKIGVDGIPAIGEAEHPLFRKIKKEANGNVLADAILSGKPYPVKALFVVGGNPVVTFPNSARLKEALGRLDLVVTTELFMTDIARCADIILPSATFAERTDCKLSPHPVMHKQVIPCEGEARSDFDILISLTNYMGLTEAFPWKTIEEAIAWQVEPGGISFQQLKDQSPEPVKLEKSYKVYEATGFSTPGGKVGLSSPMMAEHGYDPVPVYHDPDEPVSEETRRDYPLLLNAGVRKIEYIHSRYRNIPSLRKRVPEPFAEIHPETAREMDISDGDIVVIETPSGTLSIRVCISDRTYLGIVRLQHGWEEANANILTDDHHRDPVSGFPCFRSARCRIKKLTDH